jgi:Zinc carboxypeptidase
LRSNTEYENPSQFLHEKEDVDLNIKRENKKFFDYKVIGRSTKKRRLDVVSIGELVNPALKIFIMAGQHGDEKYSRKAAERLISYLIKTKAKDFPSNVCIAILPNANPDGSNKNTRTTADGIDMNSDHLILTSEENRAIHSFIRSWKPNLIVDVHDYPPKTKYLEEKNYVFYHDVLVDAPTNLGIRRTLDRDKLNNLINEIQLNFDSHNYTCDRYVLIDSDGKIRHSTHDIVDARNFLSLRYDVLSILVTGREPLSEEDQKNQIKRTISAQYLAVLSILKWATRNTDFLLDKSRLPSYNKGDKIPIRFNYVLSEQPFRMNFKNTKTNQIEEVIFTNYQSLKTIRFVKLPYAYAIPDDKESVIHLLHSHGFISERIMDSKSNRVQRHMILSFEPSKVTTKPRPPWNVRLIFTDENKVLSNYEIFPTNQEGGHCLPLLLEPQSKYALLRYGELDLGIIPGNYYPIVRVMEEQTN